MSGERPERAEARVRLVAASERDLDAVMPLVREFYLHFGYPYSEAGKRKVLVDFLRTPSAGLLLLIQRAEGLVGYALLAFSFGLEFDGPVAFVDEMYIRPDSRGGGVGAQALGHVETLCAAQGMRAVRLETERDNARAAGLYARCGYIDHQRHLMTKML